MSDTQNTRRGGHRGERSVVSTSLPKSLVALVDEVALQEVADRAAVLRDLVIHGLRAKGLMPPRTTSTDTAEAAK